MYLADYHTHSATSPDGQLTVSELAEAAVRAGLDEICVTDHVDTVLWGDHRPREHFDWSRLLRELPEARETYTGRLAIRLGAELGEAPMGFDRAEKLLAEAPKLDFVIGSVHMAGEKFKHFDLYYIEKNSETYYHRVIDSYLEDVLRLARWGRFSVLGHLTLPLRYMNENLGEQMTFDGHYDQCRATAFTFPNRTSRSLVSNMTLMFRLLFPPAQYSQQFTLWVSLSCFSGGIFALQIYMALGHRS